MEQKSPVVVHHAQETAKLTGGFGRLVVLKASYSFFQRLGTLSGHLITEEDALRRFQEDSVLLNSVEGVARVPQETGRR
jgi:hypothetical protein